MFFHVLDISFFQFVRIRRLYDSVFLILRHEKTSGEHSGSARSGLGSCLASLPCFLHNSSICCPPNPNTNLRQLAARTLDLPERREQIGERSGNAWRPPGSFYVAGPYDFLQNLSQLIFSLRFTFRILIPQGSES